VVARKLTFPAYDRIATIERSRAIAMPLLVEIILISSPRQRTETALEDFKVTTTDGDTLWLVCVQCSRRNYCEGIELPRNLCKPDG
jgi:hypothetical protein